MIGNDIIDLGLAQKESNWQRKGFLDKIFTAAEQTLILNSDAPELLVWNLWSRKEAAYKIYNRQTEIRAYIPLQLECFDLEIRDNLIYGKVLCRGNCYFTKTKITSDCIDTVAVLHSADFAKIKTLAPTVEIVKINNIPNYLPSGKTTLKPFSKSHHGRFERCVTLFD